MKRFFARVLQVVLVILFLSPRVVSGEAEVITEVQEKLISISEEEKAVLETLFNMEQEISGLEREEEHASNQVESYKQEIKVIEGMIKQEEDDYALNHDILKEILVTYQKMGPGTFLEILLDSDSIVTFLRRLNTLRDLTHNTGELMVLLDESKAKLAKENELLSEKLLLIVAEQDRLSKLLAERLKLKEEQETYLATLEDQRGTYEEYLEEIKSAWDELKPVFVQATSQFSLLIEEGNLPPDALEVSLTLSHIKGTIKEEAFNDVIITNTELPEMKFSFLEGEIELSIAKKNLVLVGNFIVEQDNDLKFEATVGSFYGLPLEQGSIEELFDEGYLVLRLKPLIGDSKVESVKSLKGSIELLIKPEF